MLISYLQKTSLVDYPGKVSAIVFTAGCNFRCPFCHNPESVLPDRIRQEQSGYPSTQEILTRLEGRRGKIDGVSICGGEPTLQSDLYSFIHSIKQMGFLVKLDTNGRDATILERLLSDKLVDYVAIDAKYPLKELTKIVGVSVDERFIQNYHACRDLLQHSDVDYEYRTTVIKGYHTNENFHHIVSLLRGAKAFYIQNYKSGKTLDPDFDGRSFTDEELKDFHAIAKTYIDNVHIRT